MQHSIEATQCVNDAILSLVKNPLLQDHAYHVLPALTQKLININKKSVTKKQNRVSYLTRKSQKA